MQQSNFTINDGATPTPVAQVFTADGSFWDTAAKRIVARWINRAKEGIARFRVEAYQKDANQNCYKDQQFVLVLPTMEPIVGGAGTGYQAAPKVAYYNTATIKVTYHERSTTVERRDLATMASNFTATSIFRDAIINDERITG